MYESMGSELRSPDHLREVYGRGRPGSYREANGHSLNPSSTSFAAIANKSAHTISVLKRVPVARVGVYGVIAFLTAEQKKEFGLRMALGPDRNDIVGMGRIKFMAGRNASVFLLVVAVCLAKTLRVCRINDLGARLRGVLFAKIP
jgi:hypothetical protein